MKKHILSLLIICSLTSWAGYVIAETRKKTQHPNIDFRSMYVSAKKAKRVIDKINLLTKVAVGAPKSFWMKKIGKWPNKRPRHKDFKNYVVKLSKKVAKRPTTIKKAYFELLDAALKNKHLRRYAHDFKKARNRANKKR